MGIENRALKVTTGTRTGSTIRLRSLHYPQSFPSWSLLAFSSDEAAEFLLFLAAPLDIGSEVFSEDQLHQGRRFEIN